MKKLIIPSLVSLCMLTGITFYASATEGSYEVYTIVVNGLPPGSNCLPNIDFHYWTTSMEGDQYVEDELNPYAGTYNLGSFWDVTMNGIPFTSVPGVGYASSGNVVCFCCSDCQYYCVTATINTLTKEIILDAVSQGSGNCQGPGCHPPN